MLKRALITGGSGYFGSLLLRRLLAQGLHCRVFDIRDAADRPAEVEFQQGDIRDLESVRKACAQADCVFHNVAQVPLAKQRKLFRSVNIDGTRNLLLASKDCGVRKVVYTSSSAVYGAPEHNPVNEETPPTPAESYGQAKLEGEQVCQEFSAQGLDVTIIRPRTIMGHGRLGIFQILFEWIRQGSNVPVLGKGDNQYQFVHAEDLAEAVFRAAQRPGSTSYNCGTDRFGTMRAALEHLCKYAGTKSKVKRVPMGPAVLGMRMTSALGLSPLGPYHALMYGRSLYFDISKAQRELDWKPRFSNEEMFVDSYEWYLKHREEILKSKDGSHHRSAVKQGILKLVQWVL